MRLDHPVAFSRHFAMPNRETCLIPVIRRFVKRWLFGSVMSVDPFARNQRLARLTNDFDLATAADFHLDAEQFLVNLHRDGVTCDAAIFDPPYSPRQVSEHYRAAGREVGQTGTQTSALYRRVRLALDRIMAPCGVVLSFGWHSNGMGPSYQLEEIMLVAHGSAHNDTICIAERKSAHPAPRRDGGNMTDVRFDPGCVGPPRPANRLRELARDIEQLARHHPEYSTACAIVQNCTDHLRAVARCMEINGATEGE